MIHFRCPVCQTAYSVPENRIGKKAHCRTPNCGQIIIVPETDSENPAVMGIPLSPQVDSQTGARGIDWKSNPPSSTPEVERTQTGEREETQEDNQRESESKRKRRPHNRRRYRDDDSDDDYPRRRRHYRDGEESYEEEDISSTGCFSTLLIVFGSIALFYCLVLFRTEDMYLSEEPNFKTGKYETVAHWIHNEALAQKRLIWTIGSIALVGFGILMKVLRRSHRD
jgi:hypothetical protein